MAKALSYYLPTMKRFTVSMHCTFSTKESSQSPEVRMLIPDAHTSYCLKRELASHWHYNARACTLVPAPPGTAIMAGRRHDSSDRAQARQIRNGTGARRTIETQTSAVL